jgi:Co/Zn/Cd efflux system component
MGNCCPQISAKSGQQRNVLWVVLAINLGMFFIEASYGFIANSLALIGDSLDMLGDAIVYGSSIVVVNAGIRQKAKVAKLKAWIMLAFGVGFSVRCIYKAIYPSLPDFHLMYIVGSAALVANLCCLFLLTRHKDDDVNMKSVWICSRNDIVANGSVLIAAGLVYLFKSSAPDIVFGIGLTFLFVKSALGILREADSAILQGSERLDEGAQESCVKQN